MKVRHINQRELWKFIPSAFARMPGSFNQILRLLCAVMLCTTAGLAEQSVVASSSAQAAHQTSCELTEAATCAPCHNSLVKDFAGNPHGKPTQKDHGLACESCHGNGEAHSQNGDTSLIFSFAKASSKIVDEKCQACHGGNRADATRSMHGRANVGCTGCHRIHSAAAPAHLLKLAQPALCDSCHSAVKSQFSMPSRHKIAEGIVQCTDCHNVHGAEEENLRRSTSWQLDECTKCHTAQAGPFLHSHPVVQAEGCTACHLPHGSENPKLLIQANMNTLCLQCHSPSLNRMTGQPAVPAHNLSTQGQSCISCHSSIHGSNASEVFLKTTQE